VSTNDGPSDHVLAYREYHAALNLAQSRARQVLADHSRRDEVQSDLTRYYSVLDRALQQLALSTEEALYLGVLLRGIEYRDSGIGAVHGVVSDDIVQENLAESRGVDAHALLRRLEAAGVSGDLAIQDAFERAGELPRDAVDAEARLRAVRVIRA
jgi:hypothetical protein